MEATRFIKPSDIIQVELPDGRFIEGPRGATAETFLSLLKPELKYEIMGCIVNGEIRELGYALTRNVCIQPLTTADSDGWVIYRRSLIFLLSATFEELFPDFDLAADHSIQSGGVFCSVKGPWEFLDDDIQKLEKAMIEKVRKNLPIVRSEVTLKDARETFRKKKQLEKIELLNYRTKPYLTTYRLEHFEDYHYGYMLPSTGYLKHFALQKAPGLDGFFLRFPKDGKSSVISPLQESPKIMAEFQQYGSWLAKLGIDNIASINKAIQENRIQEVILVAEALQNQRFMQVAQNIADRRDEVRVVLIAGPSSSGKTTSSKRLSIELLAHGISPIPIEMDNFFVDREKTPRDANGDYDFETIHALNIDLLMNCVKRLIQGEEVQLPRFDFVEGKSKPGKILRLEKEQILILEGIHGLNPALLSNIDPSQTHRIYISPLTQVNLDRYNRVSTMDVRLLRRIVRDYRDRGYSAQDTIGRWDSVRAGEEENIIPYQELANDFINTSLVYELSALKNLAELSLRLVPFGIPEYVEAKRLLSFLEWVLPLDTSLVPANSILSEFIGGSNLKSFTVWNA